MAIVCIDLWFIVKENPDKITPYYLQKTKAQMKKDEDEADDKKRRKTERANAKKEESEKYEAESFQRNDSRLSIPGLKWDQKKSIWNEINHQI